MSRVYSCPPARHRHKMGLRLIKWARQAAQRSDYARSGRLNDLALECLAKANAIERGWYESRNAVYVAAAEKLKKRRRRA